jgi:hypothetical protein
MKISSIRALAFIAISSASLLVVASCSKSNNNGSSAGISATVGGSTWSNNFTVQGVYSQSGAAFIIGGVQIKSGDSTGIDVGFGSPVTLNKALTSDGIVVDVVYIDGKTQAFYDGSPLTAGGHSTITVTSYDSTGHKVGGTFNGVLYNESNSNDSIVVTNGKFNSSYQVQP